MNIIVIVLIHNTLNCIHILLKIVFNMMEQLYLFKKKKKNRTYYNYANSTNDSSSTVTLVNKTRAFGDVVDTCRAGTNVYQVKNTVMIGIVVYIH